MRVSLAEAVQRLNQEQVVALPTETVYGLAGLAGSERAVRAIYGRKQRPSSNPLIVHVSSVDAAREYAVFNTLAEHAAAALWPGALTMVLPRNDSAYIAGSATAALPTVALRVPDHPLMQEVLKYTGALCAPSANASGRLSPVTPEHVEQSLGHDTPVLDGGRCARGLESSIILIESSGWRLLRPGAIPLDALVKTLGEPVPATLSTVILSPGQLASHYAPQARLRMNAKHVYPGEAMLAFGSSAIPEGAAAVLNLSEKGCVHEAASNLFSMLHTLDNQKHEGIAVMPIPLHGLGAAINDRLRRAAQTPPDSAGYSD